MGVSRRAYRNHFRRALVRQVRFCRGGRPTVVPCYTAFWGHYGIILILAHVISASVFRHRRWVCRRLVMLVSKLALYYGIRDFMKRL